MSLSKSYLFMAAKAIHRLNDKNLGVTIPEIHKALTREYETAKINIDLAKLETAVLLGVSKGKIICHDRVVFHLGGITKVTKHTGPELTNENSFQVTEGMVWWMNDDDAI